MSWRHAAIGAALGLAACSPQHSTSTGFLTYQANPGYVWEDKDAWFPKAIWSPGLAHNSVKHIYAATNPDHWVPQPGYQWQDAYDPKIGYVERSSTDPLEVVWRAGASYPNRPNISAGLKEGVWLPKKGYKFVSDKSLDVLWHEGVRDPDRKYYQSAASEGQWELKPGYVETTGLFGVRVVQWTAGVVHPDEPCMASTVDEGKWQAVQGYKTIRTPEGRLKMISTTGPDWIGVGVGVGVAIVGYSNAAPQENDSDFAKEVGRPLSKEIGNTGVKAAIDSFQGGNGSCSDHILGPEWQ
jgi:hypothetical protein